ncbi:hypothetical protein [Trueperella sp. LYQ143]|uniref:hypothetical protein n=1 Tax=unclassified Trueperella TaxID=2630174 RepID=UPI003983145B
MGESSISVGRFASEIDEYMPGVESASKEHIGSEYLGEIWKELIVNRCEYVGLAWEHVRVRGISAAGQIAVASADHADQ